MYLLIGLHWAHLTCPNYLVQTLRTWTLCQTRSEVWIWSNLSWIPWVTCHFLWCLTMDKNKVATIQEWEVPTRVNDVQSFLGFTNFYCRFIQGFSALAWPLITLTWKDSPFCWTPTTQLAFETLKKGSPPRSNQTIYCQNWCLWLHRRCHSLSTRWKWNPPSCFLLFSEVHTPEINYLFYDKELSTIIAAFE